MEDMDAWNSQWQALVESVGFKGDESPTEVTECIDRVRELFVNQR